LFGIFEWIFWNFGYSFIFLGIDLGFFERGKRDLDRGKLKGIENQGSDTKWM